MEQPPTFRDPVGRAWAIRLQMYPTAETRKHHREELLQELEDERYQRDDERWGTSWRAA